MTIKQSTAQYFWLWMLLAFVTKCGPTGPRNLCRISSEIGIHGRHRKNRTHVGSKHREIRRELKFRKTFLGYKTLMCIYSPNMFNPS